MTPCQVEVERTMKKSRAREWTTWELVERTGYSYSSVHLALTGDKRDETVDASRASGFRLHLAKPIDPEMLAHVVASLGF